MTMQFDKKRPLGILAALPQELGDLLAAMQTEGTVETVTLGQREYHPPRPRPTECPAWSRWRAWARWRRPPPRR